MIRRPEYVTFQPKTGRIVNLVPPTKKGHVRAVWECAVIFLFFLLCPARHGPYRRARAWVWAIILIALLAVLLAGMGVRK